ncbi:SH3 domain-containing protein [Clostridium sp.]|uniref:C40 family peptidase n=1 Tax=Clostridium sp. TaxID=1506 RepID=UPI002FC9EB54
MRNKHLKYLLAIAFAVGFSFKLNNSVALATPNENSSVTSLKAGIGIISADALNVRSNSNTSSEVMGQLYKNTKITILETKSGWYKINFNNRTGWISGEFVKQETSGAEPSNTKVGKVNASSLNIRETADTSSKILGTLKSEAIIEILDFNNNWYKIKYNDTVAYVNGDYIVLTSKDNDPTRPSRGEDVKPTTPPLDPGTSPQNKAAIITADILNVREGAGSNYTKVGVVRYGDKLSVLAHSNGWYKVSQGSLIGWISGDYLKIVDANSSITPLVRETPLAESKYSGLDIVKKAEEYLGVPYIAGGFTPLGFDCSGLVQYVYRQMGIELERTSYYQVHEGVTVSKDELKPGDLLFFTTDDSRPESVSHVGIYKGNDLFIQASKPGDVVRISNLNSAYYSNRYYIAKRIIK